MYLRKVKDKKTGRIYLSIVQSFREKGSKYPKSITIKSLGYLDDLEKTYDDPIAFCNQEIARLNDESLKDNAPLSFTIDKEERLDPNTSNRKNFGYAVLSHIYHELGIDTFLTNRQRHSKEEYDANAIMKLLTFSRLLYPASKKKTYENKERFFEKVNFSLDDVYRCLSFFNKHKDALQLWIHKKIKQNYERNTSLVYYDVTNYYFEIDEQDELRRKGHSKEHRSDPIVQMGLFMDTNGIPITYGLFPGNTLDKQTLIPMLENIQQEFSLGRIIVVADKGMTTGDNIAHALAAKNGYVFSYSIRGADKGFKNYVLDQTGYVVKNDEFKIKSRLYPREISVSTIDGKKKKIQVDEKQVVFYSTKYAAKAKADRAGAIAKAKDLIKHPSKYSQSTSVGAAKYVKNLTFDPKTGEVLEDVKQLLRFNEEKLKQEEALDGYYAIVTSEFREPDERIIDIYRGLWKIEESFKITKSDFETRPIYLSREEHIQSHFLTCFVALVMARILEYRMMEKYSVSAMIESLEKCSCSHIQKNYYLFDYYDEILGDIGQEFNIDFGKKCMSLGELKKILGKVKKG